MPISHDLKLIFIHIPKNAGTSVTESLNMVDRGHHDINYYRKKYDSCFGDYQSFAIVRNPWDRVASNYEYAKMKSSYHHSITGNARYGVHPDYELLKDKSFSDCLKILRDEPHLLQHQGWSTQTKWITDNDVIIVNNILKYEQINESITQVTGVPNLNLPVINKSNNRKFIQYYKTSEDINIVADIYKKDFNNFEYTFL